MSNIVNNTASLQALLNQVNTLPEAKEPVLQDKTITPSTSKQTVNADNGYDGLNTVTVNAMPTATQATPSITVNSSGLITASATQTAGYVTAGTKSATKQLAFQPAKTITPTKSSQVAVSSGYYTGGTITVAAIPDTYIEPSGTLNVTTNGTHNVTNYASVNVSIAGGGNTDGNTDMEDGLIARTLTTYENSEVTSIGCYAFACFSPLTSVNFPACTRISYCAFAECFSLTSVNFPACTRMDSYAFSGCTSLTTANFPVCKSISGYAFVSCKSLTSVSFPVCTSIDDFTFKSCTSLTTANFPVCTTIGASAFNGCFKLTTANFPACTSIGGYAFAECFSLTSVNFPACTRMDSYAFAYCSSLTSVSFPACTSISSGAFNCCSSLTTVSFPNCKTIGSKAFADCYSLTSVSFPACTSISSSAFCYCYRLSSLTLGASTVCKLAKSNAFISTPYAGYKSYFSGTPYIYVPASLLASYKAATNWTYFSSYFSAIEGE